MSRLLARDKNRPNSTGLQLPDPPDIGADPLAVASHYLDFYVAEYGRSRGVVKGRAKRVVIWTSAANGFIAVLGTAIAVFNATWLGLASTALAGFVGVLTTWEGLFRHREMWTQRSVILGQLLALQRTVELERATAADPNRLAQDTMRRLNYILEEDLETWMSLRSTQPIPGDGDVRGASGDVTR
ncbi:SLATT domain-containing protein [Nocardia asteroides]|uniref:SLATT domain-containing protein n=1 Tax=Nocardia asteroides TaxID=1824 RepID=UPI0037B274CF